MSLEGQELLSLHPHSQGNQRHLPLPGSLSSSSSSKVKHLLGKLKKCLKKSLVLEDMSYKALSKNSPHIAQISSVCMRSLGG